MSWFYFFALWACRTLKCISTQAMHFSLVYNWGSGSYKGNGSFGWLALPSKLSDSHELIYDMDVLQERRRKAKSKWLSYQKHISKDYNKKVKPQTLSILVLKTVGHIPKDWVLLDFVISGEDLISSEKPMIMDIFLFPSLIQKVFCLPLMVSSKTCIILKMKSLT